MVKIVNSQKIIISITYHKKKVLSVKAITFEYNNPLHNIEFWTGNKIYSHKQINI